MGKAVMLSIRPEWCEKIASGKKTVEVRKSRPKLETPFKCYIYCTFGKVTIKSVEHDIETGELFFDRRVVGDVNPYWQQRVIAEFTCDCINSYCGRCDTQEELDYYFPGSCLAIRQYNDYCNSKGIYRTAYGWHISDLVIYDKPKELSDFFVESKEENNSCKWRERVYQNPDYNPTGGLIYGGVYCRKKSDWCDKCHKKKITRQPQSWFYVEEVQDETAG